MNLARTIIHSCASPPSPQFQCCVCTWRLLASCFLNMQYKFLKTLGVPMCRRAPAGQAPLHPTLKLGGRGGARSKHESKSTKTFKGSSSEKYATFIPSTVKGTTNLAKIKMNTAAAQTQCGEKWGERKTLFLRCRMDMECLDSIAG